MEKDPLANFKNFRLNRLEKIKAEPREDLVKKYSLFKERENPICQKIYHPCGENDISPSLAFPESEVIYVEMNEAAVEALKERECEAHLASALEFNPGEVDILIMLNPTISPEIPSSFVRKEGFVLCNDYHRTASALKKDDSYKLKAIIRNKNKELIYDTEEPDGYWKEVETEEEFQSAPFSWGAIDYKRAADVVEMVTGKRENVLVEYRKIINTAREEQQKKNAELLQENSEAGSLVQGIEEEDSFFFNYEGKEILLTVLPRKKGTVDDIFVFQKTKQIGFKE